VKDNIKYEVYQPRGYALVLKSRFGRTLATVQVFYDDEDILTQKCPIPVPFEGGFQIIFQSDDSDPKIRSGRPIKYVISNHCKEDGYVKIDLGYNQIPSMVTNPPENINRINEIRSFVSVEIKSNQLDDWKQLIIKTKTKKNVDGTCEPVIFQEEHNAGSEEKLGTYLYLTVSPQENCGLSELFKDSYWSPQDLIIVEKYYFNNPRQYKECFGPDIESDSEPDFRTNDHKLASNERHTERHTERHEGAMRRRAFLRRQNRILVRGEWIDYKKKKLEILQQCTEVSKEECVEMDKIDKSDENKNNGSLFSKFFPSKKKSTSDSTESNTQHLGFSLSNFLKKITGRDRKSELKIEPETEHEPEPETEPEPEPEPDLKTVSDTDSSKDSYHYFGPITNPKYRPGYNSESETEPESESEPDSEPDSDSDSNTQAILKPKPKPTMRANTYRINKRSYDSSSGDEDFEYKHSMCSNDRDSDDPHDLKDCLDLDHMDSKPVGNFGEMAGAGGPGNTFSEYLSKTRNSRSHNSRAVSMWNARNNRARNMRSWNMKRAEDMRNVKNSEDEDESVDCDSDDSFSGDRFTHDSKLKTDIEKSKSADTSDTIETSQQSEIANAPDIMKSKVAELTGGENIIHPLSRKTFLSYDFTVRTEPKKIGMCIMDMSIVKTYPSMTTNEIIKFVETYINDLKRKTEEEFIELAKTIKKYKSDVCVVCLDPDQAPNTVLVRCGHVCTCSEDCTDILGDKCPLCKSSILCKINESVLISTI
jgi:hypothetical protein